MQSDVRDRLQTSLGSAFTLERELGGGGMSRVFVADETRLKRKVVVKVLSTELAAGVSADRFEREIQLAASLQQANIVPVLAAGEMDGVPYYTMPFVDGQSLRARLASGPLAVADVITVLRDVSKGLAYAHERGVVHRDIKPDNVLLSGGTAVVTDFGIAKALSASRVEASADTLTQLGTSMGTPAYMAPEQVAGDPTIDHRADIYSLGCMAYELLAGHTPFPDRAPQRILLAHISETPRPITELRPEVPPALAALVMRCLAKDPARRPQSANEVLATLDAAATSAAAAPGAAGAPQMVWTALAVYAGAFIAVAALTRLAVVEVGLPDWVLPGALVVMGLGLPAILFTAYSHHVARGMTATTPAHTPDGTPTPRHPRGSVAALAMRAASHLSWGRAASFAAMAFGVFVLLVLGWMAMRALGIGPAGSLLAAGKMRTHERVLVADFGVRGGADTALGSVVSEAVRTDLGQSSVVSVVPASEVRAALQRMQRPPDTRLDAALARDAAQREGIKAVVDGDVTPVGAGFIVTGRLLAAESGDVLASFQETADGPTELIPTVAKVSRDLRGKIGESLKAVRASPPLEEVTTGSLEALRKYAAGVRATDMELDYPKAIALLREAVTIDTTFAMAWRKLAVALGNNGTKGPEADSAAVRAYRYRDRLTERERYNTIGYYYQAGPTPDRAKAIEAYEALARMGVVDASTHNLALLLASRREYARAESLLRKYIATGGAPIISYVNLVNVLFFEGKIAEAESVATITQRAFPTVPATLALRVPFLYHRGQLDSIAVLATAAANSGDERQIAGGWYVLGEVDFRRGQLRSGMQMLVRGRAVDRARGVTRPVTDDSVLAALLDIAVREQPARGAAVLDAIVRAFPSLPPSARPYFDVATAYAGAGRPDRARAVLAQYDAAITDTTQRRLGESERDYALGHVLLAEGRPLDAAREFRLADRRPDGPANTCAECLLVRLGLAYDQANMPDSAIANFEQYLATPDPNRLDSDLDLFFRPRVWRRLGELYEARGDRARAAAYYERFVRAWANADPDLQPQVSEIRARLTRLGDAEARGTGR